MSELMQPLRIHAPAAEPAEDGRWFVVVPLHAAPRATVPTALATVSDWLEDVDLAATSVEPDGHTHSIRAVRSRARAS